VRGRRYERDSWYFFDFVENIKDNIANNKNNGEKQKNKKEQDKEKKSIKNHNLRS
jgi:hypothetical protein